MLLAALIALGAPALAGDIPPATESVSCSLPEIASLDFATTPEGMISIPGAVDGHGGGFLFDTGGLSGVLGWATARQLANPIKYSDVAGVFVGGTRLELGVFADRFDLGSLSFPKVWFLVAPDRMMDSNMIGELQPHAVVNTNFEIDFLKGKVNLFRPSPCPGHDVYWTREPFAQVPMLVDGSGHITVHATLDGKPVNVLIDTGAQNSTMSLNAVKHVFGIDAAGPAMKALGHTRVNNMVRAATYRYPFSSLTFEGVEIRNPNIVILDTEGRGDELIVGIGVLRQLHLFIAYDEKSLYLTAAEAR